MEVQQALPTLHAHDIDVVGISFSSPERIRWLIEEFKLTFPILHDPGRDWYELVGAGRGGWRAVFSLSILRRYLSLMKRGYRLRHSREDLRQLGGDALVTGDLVIRRWVSQESECRPTIAEVIDAADSGVEQR